MRSCSNSSPVHLPLDELVEFVPTDSLCTVAADGVDDFDKLVIVVAILELLIDVAEVVEVELALGLNVKESEVGASAFFAEGAALNREISTTLLVSSFKNCSKSRGAPLVPS